jgi:hypothetical protein
MGTIVTGQQFQEELDGIRTIYTALQPFEPGTIQVFQNSLALLPDAFVELNTIQVRFVVPDSRVVWTYDILPSTFHAEGHGAELNDPVVVWSTEIDGLPSGLHSGSTYYVRDVTPDTFAVAAYEDGPVVSFAQASAGILYYATPCAPLIENGPLHYNAVLLEDSISPSEVVGLWILSEFQEQYAPGTPLSTVRDSLLDAEDAVQQYVTETSYTAAQNQESPYRLFRRVIGELAFKYLSTRPGAVRQAKSSEKAYADSVKKMKQTYSVSSSIIVQRSEKDIIEQLYAYKRQDTTTEETTLSPYLDCWGTGRDFGLYQEQSAEFPSVVL